MRTLILVMLLTACSGAAGSGEQGAGGLVPEALLTLVGFTGGVVKAEKRFAGYAHAAQRISLIDPEREAEAWGVQVGQAYDMAAPLPAFAGVAVLTGQRFQLIDQTGASRSFSEVPFPVGFAQPAPDAAAYAMASKDGEHIHVVWKPGTRDWEEASFDSPWEDASKYAAPPDGQPPLAVTLMATKTTGTGDVTAQVVYVKPADGRYAYYEGTETQPMKLVGNAGHPCLGDPSGSPENAIYRTMAFDNNLGVVYAGDQKGMLSAFNPTGCEPVAGRAQASLGDGSPITDINVTSPGDLLVTQAGGAVHHVTYGTAGYPGFSVESYPGVCAYPLGALPAGGSRLAVVCYAPKDPPADPKLALAVITYTGVFVQIYDTSAKQAGLRIPVDIDKAAGMAIDQTSNRLLVLRDDALGVLDVVDLASGATSEKKGLFLNGILQ